MEAAGGGVPCHEPSSLLDGQRTAAICLSIFSPFPFLLTPWFYLHAKCGQPWNLSVDMCRKLELTFIFCLSDISGLSQSREPFLIASPLPCTHCTLQSPKKVFVRGWETAAGKLRQKR